MVDKCETVQELRRCGIKFLTDSNIESPAADAGLILMHVLGISKTELLTSNSAVSKESADSCRRLFLRRASGEPVQYIVGKCEFMSLEFSLSSDTLIPRPDTETLVEWIIKREKNSLRPISILDIGTGSGCIAISLAHYLARAHVLGLDISDGAIKIASQNVENLGISDRVSFEKHNILDGIPHGKFDYIVSNPPYIPQNDIEQLQREVRDFEPYAALCGGKDGLVFYRSIISNAAQHLNSGGALVFEVGIGQAGQVKQLIEDAASFDDLRVIRDLSGIERIVSAVKKSGIF